MNKNRKVLLEAILALAAVLFAVLGVCVFYPKGNNFSISNIKAVNPQYLIYSSGNVSKIFLLSAEPSYGYWTQNDTHMDWLTNGPIIHKGAPVFTINATIRNDYTKNDPQEVDSSNRSFVVLTATLYDKNGSVVSALQAYPQVDTNFYNGHLFTFDSNETTTIGLIFATDNRNIDHYDISVATVSSMPPP